jgi:peptide/nickel transport system substrate-binding protein
MRYARIALALLASATALGGPVAVAAQGKIVVAANFRPAAAFALETDDAFVLMRAGCLEALARIDFDGKLQPSLAKSWTQTAPMVWTIALREGVKFHDGRPLDAEAVAKSLNHILKVAAPPRAFSPRAIKAVEAVDAMTVRITSAEAGVLLPYRLASPNTGILSPAAYQPDGKINPVGACTGPFVLREIVAQQAIKLVRNPAYWGGPVALAEAEVRFIPDGGVRATQVRTGEAHIARILPVAMLRALAAERNIEVKHAELPRTTALYFNNKKAPLSDARVRRAIQAAIDVQAIVAGIYEGRARAAIGPFAPAEPWAPKSASPAAANFERAKALLAEAKVEPGKLKLEVLAYSERPELKDLAAVIQDQLKKIGIQVDIRLANYAALEPDMLSGKHDMTLLSRSHLTDVADPAGFLAADYTCAGGYNISHYCDAAIDAAIKQAGSLEDAAQRHEAYAKVAEKLQADAVNVFIVHEQQSDAISRAVKNYRIHPLSHYVLVPNLSLN